MRPVIGLSQTSRDISATGASERCNFNHIGNAGEGYSINYGGGMQARAIPLTMVGDMFFI